MAYGYWLSFVVAWHAHAIVFLGLVADDDELLHALGVHALGNLQHRVAFGPLAHALTTGHGHGVVVQNLVGDVDARRDALANRQQAAVKVSAIAQVGEDVLFVAEGLLPHPRHALAAHLREADGRAVWHPGRHVVAANAAHGARALGHAGAGVVRAARAEPGHAHGIGQLVARADLQLVHAALIGFQQRHLRFDASPQIAAQLVEQAGVLEPLDQRTCDQGRVQVGVGAQQRVGRGVGARPFAASKALGVVLFFAGELADHAGPHVRAPVVQLFFELVLDHLALFFDHQNLLQARGELARQLRFERPHHAHLVQANADLAAGFVVQAQVQQGLARVVVGLAAGHDAETVVRPLDHVVVQPVGADVGQRGVPLVVHQPRFLLQRRIGPANVQAARRHLKVGWHDDLDALRVDGDRGARLDDFLNRLQARPHAREAAQRERVNAQIQNLLHVRREEHRRATGLEDVVALVRGRAALADVIVPGHGNHATPLGGARHVGVLEHVRAAVHTRPLAIPNAEHAVELVAARWRITQLLRAPHGRGAQFFVHAGLKDDVLFFEHGRSRPQCLVVATQGRPPVAADEAGRALAQLGIALLLQHGQLDEGMDATHEGLAQVQRVLVVQADGFQRAADVVG